MTIHCLIVVFLFDLIVLIYNPYLENLEIDVYGTRDTPEKQVVFDSTQNLSSKQKTESIKKVKSRSRTCSI